MASKPPKAAACPCGSYNHSYADRNCFVVSHLGQRLVIASGHCDGHRPARTPGPERASVN